MNSEKLQQLQNEIHREMKKALNSSKMVEVLDNYGLVDKLVKIQCVLDLTKIQSSNAIKDPEIKDSLRAIPGQQIVIMDCCLCPRGCCNC